MHKLTKKFVAILCGIATLVGPTTALAEGDCRTYFQVKSDATGGEHVGGLLIGESEKEVTEENSYTLHMTAEMAAKIFGTGGTVGSQGTHTKTTVEKHTFDIGHYQMNDGSRWEVNCDTGEYRRVG